MAANLASEMNDTDKVVRLLVSAKKMGIEIMPPDVNTSYTEFHAVSNTCIAYGMAAIKNMGSKAAQAIADGRKKYGRYKNIFDLCQLNSNLINRKSVEALIQSGACDSLEGHRAQLFELIDDAIRWGHKISEDAASAQESLFGEGTTVAALAPPALPEVEEWTLEECLRREKNMIGFYMSGDPLEKYIDELNEFSNVNLADIPEKKPAKIRIGGIIRSVNSRYDKKNKPWAIIEINGTAGKADIFVFSAVYEKTKDLLNEDSCVFIKGAPSDRDENSDTLKLIATDIFPLEKARDKLSRNINILIDNNQNGDELLNSLKEISEKNKGRRSLILHLKAENGTVQRIRATKLGVSASNKFVLELRNLFGDKHVWIS